MAEQVDSRYPADFRSQLVRSSPSLTQSKQKGRDRSRPFDFCLFLAVDRDNQAFLWLARRVQVSTTVSGFREMLLMP